MAQTNNQSSGKTSQSSSSGATKAKRPRRVVIRNTIISVTVAVLAAPFLIFGVAYVATDVPEPDELATKQIAQIFASDSTTELARIVPPEGNRKSVPLDQIPEVTRYAVLAAEDRQFYTNNGFSFTGFGRAILGQLTGNSSAGGGSTITQQYVKNMVVGNDYSYKRKAKELVYSVKMANEWSKEEVLQAYLNTIYFGRNAYGIDAAAKAYFGVEAQQLDAAQSAVLAASIQRPSELDPWNNPEEALERWNYVLDGMVTEGWLDANERANLSYPETTDPALNEAYTEATGPNGLIKNQVMAELATVGISEDDVQTKGLRITTTIDMQAQNATIETVRQNLEGQRDNIRTATVSIEPTTGAVRAYYGGEDATGWDYANAPLQTGSTFKIFGVAAAVQQGIPTTQMISTAPFQLPGGITVPGSGCNGACTVAEALKQSLNTPFLRLQDELAHTSQDTADMAHALGIAESLPGIEHTLTENGEQPFEGIILGQYLSRPMDMAQALSTLANEGVYHKAHFVQKVETSQGEVLYQRGEDQGERRVAANVANTVINAMLPIANWSGYNDLAGGRQSAAKTGTTQLGDTGMNKDAWMIGATPQLATAVWVGTDDNTALLNQWGGSMYGASLPATIWKGIQDGALQGQENLQFPTPEPLGFNKGRGTIGPVITQAPTPSTEAPQEEQPAPVDPFQIPLPANPVPDGMQFLEDLGVPANWMPR